MGAPDAELVRRGDVYVLPWEAHATVVPALDGLDRRILRWHGAPPRSS